MLKKFFPVVILLGALALALTDCSPVLVNDNPTPTSPATPAATSEPAIREALIDSIDIQISESMPVQINVVAHGHLSEACAQLSDVKQRYEPHEFQIAIFSASPIDRGCAQVTTSFDKVIPLNVTNLPAGAYTVAVNGVRGSFRLAIDNVPPVATTPTAPPAAAVTGSISGWLWHDLCAVSPQGSSIKPSAGCVQDGLLYRANGILENGEPPIGGVKVRLSRSKFPSRGAATA